VSAATLTTRPLDLRPRDRAAAALPVESERERHIQALYDRFVVGRSVEQVAAIHRTSARTIRRWTTLGAELHLGTAPSIPSAS